MAYDAGMAYAVCHEMRERFIHAKIEKIYQPSSDTLVLLCRRRGESRRILLSASPSGARVSETTLAAENPKTPPMFCMQLRKHLVGAVIHTIETEGFERVIAIAFDAYDEMGFVCRKYLMAEIMGKYSNLVFLSEENGKRRVLGALKPVDFTTSSKRQVLPGMLYELPPRQDKFDPMTETAEHFHAAYLAYPKEKAAEKFILDTYLGLSPLAAREIAHRANCLGKLLCEISRDDVLWRALSSFCDAIRENAYRPVMLSRTADDGDCDPFDYCFFEVEQYANTVKTTVYPDFASLFDAFYGTKERIAAMRSRSRDMESVLSSVRHRLAKKLPQLTAELAECDEMDTFKRWGDLVTASMGQLAKKASFCEVIDYYDESLPTVRIPLDGKLTPSQNAARYYKKYTKLKTARAILTEQIEKAKDELSYLDSVEEVVSRAECDADLLEIRRELIESGYLARTEKQTKDKKKPALSVFRTQTASGRELYIGRNNLQNDYLTTKLARKSDYWFHVKGGHGSHVIMSCEIGEDPPAKDFTEAAAAAAYYSELRGGEKVAVDYTLVKNVKKPSGAVPGRVVYYTNYTAYVDPKKPQEIE